MGYKLTLRAVKRAIAKGIFSTEQVMQIREACERFLQQKGLSTANKSDITLALTAQNLAEIKREAYRRGSQDVIATGDESIKKLLNLYQDWYRTISKLELDIATLAMHCETEISHKRLRTYLNAIQANEKLAVSTQQFCNLLNIWEDELGEEPDATLLQFLDHVRKVIESSGRFQSAKSDKHAKQALAELRNDLKPIVGRPIDILRDTRLSMNKGGRPPEKYKKPICEAAIERRSGASDNQESWQQTALYLIDLFREAGAGTDERAAYDELVYYRDEPAVDVGEVLKKMVWDYQNRRKSDS